MDENAAKSRIMPSSRSSFVPGRAAVSGRQVTRVCIGAYVHSGEWDALFSEERLRTLVHAVAMRMTVPRGAFALASAAAVHGLPLYRIRAERVDLIIPGRHPRHSGTDVARHHMPLPEADVATIDGLRVTCLDRTVYDVIRLARLETAVVVFDAALRRVAWDEETNVYSMDEAERFRARVTTRVVAHAGARGIRQARFVTDFADGRAQLPGESISRLWMWQLGVPAPVLQYRVALADGRYALLDFCWPAAGRWGEFDGESKYTGSELLAGRTTQEVLGSQEQRQQAISAATGWRCDRWGFDRMPTIDDFAKHLRSIGLLGRLR